MSPSRFQILLVEDAESDARLFETALRDAAPRVKLYWVASAEEGMEYLRRENRFQHVGPVDLIVSDLNMPGLDGYQLLEKVKRDVSLKKTPFVVYSGSSAPRDIQLCYTLGANSYLVKPMTVESMVQQLKALVHYWLEVVALPGIFMID